MATLTDDQVVDLATDVLAALYVHGALTMDRLAAVLADVGWGWLTVDQFEPVMVGLHRRRYVENASIHGQTYYRRRAT